MEHVVRLAVPAESRNVRLVRVNAATVAADAGLDVDDVEDVRVAVTELFALLVEDAESSDTQVDVTYRTDDSGVTIEGRRDVTASTPAPALDDLALGILRVIVDEHDFSADDRERRFSLTKRRAPR
jgi:serine/threonine-protein kinase RsbW